MMTPRELVREGLHALGWSLRRYSWATDSFARRVKMLRAAGIATVIDVGGSRGDYSIALRRAGFNGRIISIEPLRDAYQELEKRAKADGRWEAFNFAASDECGEARIQVATNSVSSSLLPMTAAHEEGAPDVHCNSSYMVQCRTLDDLGSGVVSAGDRVFLKIDTQGYEDRVLKGAAAIIQRTVLIECELSLVALYEGQLLFPEMLSLLETLGFQIVLLEPAFSDAHSGYCLQLDGVFAAKNGRAASVPA